MWYVLRGRLRSTYTCLNGLLDPLIVLQSVCDVEVGTQAHETWLSGSSEHAFARQRAQELDRSLDCNEDEVSLRFRDLVSGVPEPGGERK